MTNSDAPQKYKYRLMFVPSALKEWNALDGSVKEPLQQQLRKHEDNVAYKSAVTRVAEKATLLAVALKRKAVKQARS